MLTFHICAIGEMPYLNPWKLPFPSFFSSFMPQQNEQVIVSQDLSREEIRDISSSPPSSLDSVVGGLAAGCVAAIMFCPV